MGLHILRCTLVMMISSIIMCSGLKAQVTPFPFEGFKAHPRTFKVDGRSVSMAEATLADPGAFSSFSINPALLSYANHPTSVNLNGYQNWQNNLFQTDLTLPALSYLKHSFLVRLGFFKPGLGLINPIGINPQPEPDMTLYQVDLAYSYQIHSEFSAGVLQTFSYGNNQEAQYATYMTNLGIFYVPSGPVSYAIVLNGLGKEIEYQFIEDGTTILGSRDAPISLEIGATYRYPVDVDQPHFSLSLSNEKKFGEAGLWYKGGMEIKPISHLSFRGGMLFKPTGDFIYLPRFGLGVEAFNLKLDYGISPKKYRKERYHTIGITIQL